MRIGLVASTGHHLDSFFPEIVKYWERLGHHVFPAAGTATKTIRADHLAAVTRRPSIASLNALHQIKRWRDARDLDVILTNTATASFLVRAALTDTPVVYFAHGLHWANPKSVSAMPWQLLELLVLRRSSGVIVINDEDEAWFQRHGSSVPRLRLPYGVGLDVEAFPRQRRKTTGKPTFVWVGEHSPRKNPLDVIEIAEMLRTMVDDFQVRILGRGSLTPKLAEAVKLRALESNVELVGHVPVLDAMLTSDVLLHTARWEGLPRVFLESLSCGRPVVSYDIKGARGLLGVTTVPVGDHRAMARAALELVAPEIEVTFPDPADLRYENTAELVIDFLASLTGHNRIVT